jgi:predicted methyltransferase
MKLGYAVPLALLCAAPALAQTPAKSVTTALADPSRPAADRDRDAARKPAAIIAFAGIKRGDKVADFIMGGGYWTRILSGVVGPKGRVYAYQPAEFIAFRAAYGTEQDAAVAGRANVVPSRDSLTVAAFPEPLDAIITSQNWHDLHLKVAPAGSAAAMARHLFGLLKPGGTLLVIDHAAAAGAPLTVADTLHRIDPAKARAEIEAAGFRFDGESPVLRQPGDSRTQLVFDPAIRGKTDQFVFRFRKPR